LVSTEKNASVRHTEGKIIKGLSWVDSEIDLNEVKIIHINGTTITTAPAIKIQ
jgi:hypothetical protein